MFESKPSKEILNKAKLLELTRQSVATVHEQNPNALGFVVHGTRANEGAEGKKQPRENSDLDVIVIRKNKDNQAAETLANKLWENVDPKYGVLVDTGPWGSLEWEEILKAVASPADKEKFRRQWAHLGASIIIVGSDSETENMVKKALLE